MTFFTQDDSYAPVADAFDGTLLTERYQSSDAVMTAQPRASRARAADSDGSSSDADDTDEGVLDDFATTGWAPVLDPQRSLTPVADALLPDMADRYQSPSPRLDISLTSSNASRAPGAGTGLVVLDVEPPPSESSAAAAAAAAAADVDATGAGTGAGARSDWRRLSADSGYWTIDLVRAFGVLCTTLLTYNQRLTYMANPVAGFFGGDWCATLFLFGCGSRCACDFYFFQRRVAAQQLHAGDTLRTAHLRQAVQSCTFSLMTIVCTLLYVVIVFGPRRVCASDILVTLGISCIVTYPFNYAPTWVSVVLGAVIVFVSPVLFAVTGGAEHWAGGYLATDWSAKGVLGGLAFFDLFPLFPYTGYVFLGSALMRYTMCSARDTAARRAGATLVGLVLMVLGVEVRNSAAVHPDYASDWHQYFYAAFNNVPVTLSFALFTIGVCIVLTMGISFFLDPVPTPAPAEAPKPPSGRSIFFHDMLSRASYYVTSIYFFESGVLFCTMRAVGSARHGDANHFILPPAQDLLLPRKYEVGANFLSIFIALCAATAAYTLVYVWDRFGKQGFLTVEHTSARVALSIVPRLVFSRRRSSRNHQN